MDWTTNSLLIDTTKKRLKNCNEELFHSRKDPTKRHQMKTGGKAHNFPDKNPDPIGNTLALATNQISLLTVTITIA